MNLPNSICKFAFSVSWIRPDFLGYTAISAIISPNHIIAVFTDDGEAVVPMLR
jgi:hypothetical protein